MPCRGEVGVAYVTRAANRWSLYGATAAAAAARAAATAAVSGCGSVRSEHKSKVSQREGALRVSFHAKARL